MGYYKIKYVNMEGKIKYIFTDNGSSPTQAKKYITLLIGSRVKRILKVYELTDSIRFSLEMERHRNNNTLGSVWDNL